MKYAALLLIILAMPANAQDWEQADRDNAATWQHEQAEYQHIHSENGYEPQKTWQPPELVYGDNRQPVEILQDCASTGSCAGAFDPYR